MSKKSSQQRVDKERRRAELNARREHRNSIIKRVLVIVLCVFLVIAFCLPAITTLI